MNNLAKFCQNDSFLKAKIALITSFNQSYSHIIEKLVVLYEYFQLMSHSFFLQFNTTTAAYQIQQNHLLFKAVIYFLYLINPSYLLPYTESSYLPEIILLIMFCCTILKYMLFVYIIYIAYFDRKGSALFAGLWKIVFQVQGRILCFLTASFWVQGILNSYQENFSFFGIKKTVFVGICVVLIAVEYIFSFFLQIQFCCVLPTENLLASKDYGIEMITLTQKLFLQILQMIFESGSSKNVWIFTTFNLFLSMFRVYFYYKTLPLYHSKGLLYQSKLLSTVVSLDLTCFLWMLIKDNFTDYNELHFIVILWCITSLLINKLFSDILERKLVNIILCDQEYPPHLLCHKISLLNQLQRALVLPGKQSKKYNITYLLNTVKDINMISIFKIPNDKICESKESLPQADEEIFIQYTENLVNKFPRSSFAKLYLAYLCSKSPELHIKAIKCITEIAQKRWSKTHLSALLLLQDVQRKLMTDHINNKEDNLDFIEYIKSQVSVEKIRNEILNQTELKIAICTNILGEKADIGQIHNHAQLIAKSKQHLEIQIALLNNPNNIPDYCTGRFLLCAGYYLILHYSHKSFQKYSRLYTQKQTKYIKPFQALIINQENLYQDTSVFVILSCEKFNTGKIVFCSNSLQAICGGSKAASYHGSHISTLFTPSFQPFYNTLFKQVFDSEQRTLLDERVRAYLQHKDGYIVEVELYVRLHPYLTKNLYLDMIIRPVPSNKEYFLVKENGDIEGATRVITKALSIKTSLDAGSKLTNVKVLSEELYQANEALNIVPNQSDDNMGKSPFQSIRRMSNSKVVQDGNLVYKKAQELSSIYMSQGKVISLMPLGQENKKEILYHVTISNIPELTFLRLFTLEEIANESENEEANHKIDTNQTLDKYEERNDNSYDIENEVKDENNKDLEIISENFQMSDAENDFKMDTHYNNEINIITTDANLLSTNRYQTEILSSNRRNYALLTYTARLHSKLKKQTQFKPTQVWSNKPQGREKPIKVMSSIQGALSSQDKRVHESFRTSIETRSYPKTFKFLCIAFYGIILLVFGCQIFLKVAQDSTMSKLVLEKNLLTYSQLRSYTTLLIDINSRAALNILLDPLNLVNKGATTAGLSWLIPNIKTHQPELESYNQMLLNNLDSLDSQVKQQMTAKDITILGSFTDTQDISAYNITNFEMVDLLINAVDRLAGLANQNSTEALDLTTFLIRNGIGGFQAKSSEISDLLNSSVETERESFKALIKIFLVLTPLLVGGIALTLISIIWKQYKVEESQMLEVLKLNANGVKRILATLNNFKKRLSGEEFSGHQEILDYFNKIASLSEEAQETGYHKPQRDQTISYFKIRKRYYGYIAKVMFYMLILIAVMILNYILADKSTQVIYRRQSQIEFANYISGIVSITYSAAAELSCSNNTYKLKNLLPLDMLTLGINELVNIQTQIPAAFQDIDGTYDPQVQALIFQHHDCSGYNFSVTLYAYYCNYLETNGQLTNLLSLIVSNTESAQGKLSDYMTCDKSNIFSLMTCGYRNLDSYLPPFVVAAAEAQLINNIVGTNLEKNVSDANEERNLLLGIFFASLIFVSILIWLQILMNLREVYNDFKKVLQVFPPALILSSFLLKSFLQKNSKTFINLM